jgi:hypothetical protein
MGSDLPVGLVDSLCWCSTCSSPGAFVTERLVLELAVDDPQPYKTTVAIIELPRICVAFLTGKVTSDYEIGCKDHRG